MRISDWSSDVCSSDLIDDAIRISNSTAYGLSSGVCTNHLEHITRFVSELRVGTVNVWEVPGYRIEMSPFGGIKDSGLGYKEGVLEAMKSFTNVKTRSEEHTSELQSLMRISYAVFCLKKKNNTTHSIPYERHKQRSNNI